MERLTERTILSQPSWVLTSDRVEMAITHRGAHMAPVRFARNTNCSVEPYYISPWQGESIALGDLWSEVPLRGDFFCMPFGMGNFELEKHPPHGETSGALWTLAGSASISGVHNITLELETECRIGWVQRVISLVDGEDVIYDRTTIHGFSGPITMAHHAVLRAPQGDGSLLVSNSGIQFGSVYPYAFGKPENGEYQSLEVGAQFNSLESVPSIFKGYGSQDCSRWPARQGFTDLLQIANYAHGDAPAWTAAVNTEEHYLWFAFKDVRTLPSTVIWMENRGRHARPWNGRNCALGLEDACTFFDGGILQSSQQNSFSERGIKTHHVLNDQPFHVNYVQGATPSPEGFGKVVRAEFDSHSVTFHDATGKSVLIPVQVGFLLGHSLKASPSIT